MKNGNIIQEKSFAFAIRVINLYKYLTKEKNEFVLSKQLLRSGTSVGANIEEAIGGGSGKDFLYRMRVSYKEIRESIYWLKLLYQTEYISLDEYQSIIRDAESISNILCKILLSTQQKLNHMSS